jgi:hypothetical protein
MVLQQLDGDGNGTLALEELECALRDPATRLLAAELLRRYSTALMLPGGIDYYEFQKTWAAIELTEAARDPARDAGQENRRVDEVLEPTAADITQVIGEVLSHRCGLGNLDHLHDRYSAPVDARIRAVFPLKDYHWQKEFLKRWTREGGIVLSCKRIKGEFEAAGHNTRERLREAHERLRNRMHEARENFHTHCPGRPGRLSGLSVY